MDAIRITAAGHRTGPEPKCSACGHGTLSHNAIGGACTKCDCGHFTPVKGEARCLRCRRVLRSAKSVADNYGPGCAAKIRRAAREHALDGLTAKQAAEAAEIAADGGVVESSRPGVFQVTSGDGSQFYRVTPDGHCTCAWGLRRTMADTKVCKHVGAVRLVISGRPAQSRTAFRTAA